MSGHTLIIDPGSGFIKAGYQVEDAPRSVFPTIIGRPRRRYAAEFEGTPAFVGDAAVEDEVRGRLSFNHPIDHGHVDDWLEIEELWSYTFNTQLQASPSDCSLVFTVPPLCSSTHKEKILESMFEGFDAPEVCLCMQGVMSLYSSGRTTGIVVEIGEGITQVVPVYEGFSPPNVIGRSDLGGQEITMLLQKLLNEEGYSLTKRDDYEYIRIMKEKICYVAADPIEEDTKDDTTETFVLPDGTPASISSARFTAPEVLFDPTINGQDNPPLVDLIWKSVQASSLEVRKPLMASVVLSGGSSLFKGLPERLEAELKLTAPPQARTNVRIVAKDDRLFSVWTGARLFADPGMRSMQEMYWTTSDEWAEEGVRILKKKVGS